MPRHSGPAVPRVPRVLALSARYQAFLRQSGLVDDEADLARVRLHTGGPIAWYLRRQGRSAITLGRHIWFVSAAKRDDPALLVHELVHVAQFRRMGTVRFLVTYLCDLARARFRYGRDLPLEAPAYERQGRSRERH